MLSVRLYHLPPLALGGPKEETHFQMLLLIGKVSSKTTLHFCALFDEFALYALPQYIPTLEYNSTTKTNISVISASS